MVNVKSNYSVLKNPTPRDFTGSVSLNASNASGSVNIVTFVKDPTQPSQTATYLRAPASESWLLYNVYTHAQTPNADGVIQFKVDTVDQGITFGPLSETYRDIQHPIVLKDQAAITVEPNGELELFFVPDATPSTTTTVSFRLRVVRIPLGYKGNVAIGS